jgi:hypothetical protein
VFFCFLRPLGVVIVSSSDELEDEVVSFKLAELFLSLFIFTDSSLFAA